MATRWATRTWVQAWRPPSGGGEGEAGRDEIGCGCGEREEEEPREVELPVGVEVVNSAEDFSMSGGEGAEGADRDIFSRGGVFIVRLSGGENDIWK
jgi:hypothetical protein